MPIQYDDCGNPVDKKHIDGFGSFTFTDNGEEYIVEDFRWSNEDGCILMIIRNWKKIPLATYFNQYGCQWYVSGWKDLVVTNTDYTYAVMYVYFIGMEKGQ